MWMWKRYVISVTNTLELRSAQIFPKGAQKRQKKFLQKAPNFRGLFGQKRPNSRIFTELFLKVKYWGINAFKVFFEAPHYPPKAPIWPESARFSLFTQLSKGARVLDRNSAEFSARFLARTGRPVGQFLLFILKICAKNALKMALLKSIVPERLVEMVRASVSLEAIRYLHT